MNNSIKYKLKAFERILGIMDDLREKCPWDRKQTMESLRNLTIEETYELVDAITEGDLNDIKEEVGDLFLHMIFYSKIGEEKEAFNVGDVLNCLSDKLIERHPHIYGDVKVESEEEVKQNWEKIKLKTRKKGLLSGVPKSLPAMIKSYRMQEKTAQVGFEWEDVNQVWDKVNEEIAELHEAINEQNKSKIEEEFGDVLFSLINYARFLDVDPENALQRVNTKFKSRFEFIENNASKNLTDMSLDEMDELWNKAKHLEY